jgi:hypothetical protein
MRNGGILGGLFPDDGQDLAFRDLAPLGEPAWAQATRDLMARSAQGSAAARDYPIPSQPAPWFPSAPSITNTWPAQPQPTTYPYLNSRAQGPEWSGDSAGNPPPLLHELPYFATGPEPSGANNNAYAEGPSGQGNDVESTPLASALPIGFRGAIPVPYPGFGAPFPDLQEWRNRSLLGHMGLWNYLRSFRGGGGGGRDDDEDCDKRYEQEIQNCHKRTWRMPAHYLGGCLARAQSRWLKCLGNGGKPHPDELDEWGDKDEETWRNFGR